MNNMDRLNNFDGWKTCSEDFIKALLKDKFLCLISFIDGYKLLLETKDSKCISPILDILNSNLENMIVWNQEESVIIEKFKACRTKYKEHCNTIYKALWIQNLIEVLNELSTFYKSTISDLEVK